MSEMENDPEEESIRKIALEIEVSLQEMTNFLYMMRLYIIFIKALKTLFILLYLSRHKIYLNKNGKKSRKKLDQYLTTSFHAS